MGLAGFALACLIAELTPGPNMTWLAVSAAVKGRLHGLRIVAGIALGLSVAGLAAALGLAAVIRSSPLAWEVMRWAGIATFLWLAFDAWRDAGAPAEGGDGGFLQGLITNLINPKAYVFYITVLPRFTDPGAPLVPQTVTLSLIFVAIATAVHSAIVLSAARLGPFLAASPRAAPLRRAMALALVGVAVWLGVTL